ncbi:hypothetical protein SSPO_028390 [Streptomyces antimycoticus]|uniref:Uncharacterized protein n=1 Tax=Streptomyces antimycoticus TaxID=68175 RepID=A0A499USA3_9ACTN|nr:hypothetical protein SSPO_028390 [Streptomyces antimycoticus]
MLGGGGQRRDGALVADRAQALDAGAGDRPVAVTGSQLPFQRGDQGRYGLGGPQLHQQPDRVQGVRGAQRVGGQGGGGPRGARIAEAGQHPGGGRTAGRLTVVEQEDKGFEGPAVSCAAEHEGGRLTRPQRLLRRDQDAGQLFARGGGALAYEREQRGMGRRFLRG